MNTNLKETIQKNNITEDNYINDKIQQLYWIFWVDKLNIDLENDLKNLINSIFEDWLEAWVDEDEDEDTRKCNECWKIMTEWYCINWWEEYYCWDECLHKHYTEEEREDIFDNWNSDSYRTEREK